MAETTPPNTTAGETALAFRLAKNIASRRKALELTQAQLAERLGVDTETLSRFERGKHLPSLVTLERLADVLVATVGELLAEPSRAPDEDALTISAWLAGLKPADKAFAKSLLKQFCDHLSSRRGDSTGS